MLKTTSTTTEVNNPMKASENTAADGASSLANIEKEMRKKRRLELKIATEKAQRHLENLKNKQKEKDDKVLHGEEGEKIAALGLIRSYRLLTHTYPCAVVVFTRAQKKIVSIIDRRRKRFGEAWQPPLTSL